MFHLQENFIKDIISTKIVFIVCSCMDNVNLIAFEISGIDFIVVKLVLYRIASFCYL
jgi:hypothetical protein